MLSIMLGFGVLSRLVSGLVADKVGGLPTLIAGSAMQMLALIAYIPFDGLASLYIVSAIFGLSQGGIVPSYALIIRDHFPAREAGSPHLHRAHRHRLRHGAGRLDVGRDL